MIKLYEASMPGTRSARCRWTLEELEVPFDSITVDLSRGEHREAPFLKINPYGRVPVLADGSLILSESVAICTYLADKFIDQSLIPRPGTKSRGRHDQWLLFAATELDPPLWQIRRHTALYPQSERSDAEVERSRRLFLSAAELLERELNGRCWILADRFTVADIVITHTLNWGAAYGLLHDFEALQAYLKVNRSRPHCPRELALR